MKLKLKTVIRVVGILLAIVALVAVLLFSLVKKYQGQLLAEPLVDLIAPNILVPEKRQAVLLFSKTYGYRHHSAIAAGEEMFSDLGVSNNWFFYATENAAVFNAEQLAMFDVVVWNCATKPTLSSAQQEAFKNYIIGGGGFIGIHGAGDDSHKLWPWYQTQLIRATFIGHPLYPKIQEATINVEQSQHPVMRGLGPSWKHNDEWYSFEKSPSGQGVTVLATVDESTYKPGRWLSGRALAMGEDHPVIWSHNVGSGRVVYTSLGHQAETFNDLRFRKFIEQAVNWVGRQY